MLGVIHGVGGSPCSPLGLPETLLGISWLNHYAKGSPFAHYFSWGNWADNTQSKRKGVTGERRNLKWNDKEQKQTKQQVHTREARTSQEARLIGVTWTTYRGTREGQGMPRGPCPAQGLAQPPLHHQGKGLPLPQRHALADSDRTAPQKEAQRGWGGKQKENNHRQKALLCLLFVCCNSCPNSFPKLRLAVGEP